jgi:uncharacterized protein with ParB-like and HNH nuclease domain
MQASETKLQQIIEGTKQYVVPLFQRSYSWRKLQWQQLWDDILELSTSENPRLHFMGSIVTMPTTSVPEGVTKYTLIDGQQRLTTIFILLCALRDQAKLSEEEYIVIQIWSYFGDESPEPSKFDNLTGSTPKLLRILDEEYDVESWRDVLETTLNVIYDMEAERFQDIMYLFPNFVGLDEKDFRSTRKLKNGAFIEVHLNVKTIYSFCMKALEIAELSAEDWYVETINK